MKKLYKIGELASISGVPVKTIRYYSDLGLLPPTEVRGKLRLYSEGDRARLALIRSLRDIGVDLASITQLLESKTSVTETLSLQLDAVDVGIRTLQRRRAVLRAAVKRGGDGALDYLERLRKLSELDGIERRKLVEDYLDRAFDGIPIDERWKQDFRRLAVFDIPESLSDAQLDAWLELAELIADEDFIARMRAIGRESWGDGKLSAQGDDWRRQSREIETDALRLADAGEPETSPPAQDLVRRYLELEGRVASRRPDSAFAREVIDRVDRHSDRRATRFWELVATLKGWKNPTDLPTTRAYKWLFTALRSFSA